MCGDPMKIDGRLRWTPLCGRAVPYCRALEVVEGRLGVSHSKGGLPTLAELPSAHGAQSQPPPVPSRADSMELYTVDSVDPGHPLRFIPHGRRTSPSASTSVHPFLQEQEVRVDVQFVARDQRECHFYHLPLIVSSAVQPF